MELSGFFLGRNKMWVCFSPSCREYFHWKSNQSGTSETWKVDLDSLSSCAPQSSAELQDYRVTSSACVQLSTGKAALHFTEAQEEICALSASLSSDRCANNITGHASSPLMTNASISWCQLISACPSGRIKQGRNCNHQWRRCCQGMAYKAAKETLPPFPDQRTCGGKTPGTPPEHSCALVTNLSGFSEPWSAISSSAVDHSVCKNSS